MKFKFFTVLFAALLLGCCYVHRRVFLAILKGEPVPMAPKWHLWVAKKGRRE